MSGPYTHQQTQHSFKHMTSCILYVCMYTQMWTEHMCLCVLWEYIHHIYVHVHVEYKSVVGSSPTRGSSFFLGKVTALGVLCCFALFVCLTLLAFFFLPSHLSFKNMYVTYIQCTISYCTVCILLYCIYIYMHYNGFHSVYSVLYNYILAGWHVYNYLRPPWCAPILV